MRKSLQFSLSVFRGLFLTLFFVCMALSLFAKGETGNNCNKQVVKGSIQHITVAVSGDKGVFPKGTSLVLKLLSEEEKQVYVESLEKAKQKAFNATAIDITLLNEKGEKIQPKGEVLVTISGTQLSNKENISVYHVEEGVAGGANFVEKEMEKNKRTAVNTISFKTTHFSIYLVAAPTHTHTYQFFVDGSEITEFKQIVKNGETLLAPASPIQDKKVFLGWYDSSDNKMEFVEGEAAGITVVSTQNIELHAKFESRVYIYFKHKEDGYINYQVIKTKWVEPGQTIDDSDIKLAVTSEGKIFSHWSTSENGAIFDFNTPINDHTSLYSVLKVGYTVFFDAKGGLVNGESILPQPLISGTPATEPNPAPTKLGYTFQHWSETENGSAFNFSTPITANKTLHAVWTPGQVKYTVVHMTENANDDNYSFKESEEKQGTAGTNTNATAKNYNGFTVEPITQKVIKGDGSTIVYVKYKRKEYSLKFYKKSGGSWNEDISLRITAKHGVDITGRWPGGIWEVGSSSSNIYVANQLQMPLGGEKYYQMNGGSNNFTFYYYVQALPGEGENPPATGCANPSLKYVLHHRDDFTYSGNLHSNEADRYAIHGFTYDGHWKGNVDFEVDANGDRFLNNCYTRNQYNLNFYNGGYGLVDSKTIYFDEPLDSYELTAPEMPAGVLLNSTFGGWYDNEECLGDPVDFSNKKMPADNLLLYAKWIPPVHKLTAYQDDNIAVFKEFTDIPHNGILTPEQQAELNISNVGDDEFVGWYWYVGDKFVSYDFERPMDRDIEIYQVWNRKGFNIVYKIGAEYAGLITAPNPPDSNEYLADTYGRILSPASVAAGQKFLGWKDKLGNVYQPNDGIHIITAHIEAKKVELTPVLSDKYPEKTQLTYNSNYTGGAAPIVIEDLLNNATQTVKPADTFTRQYYVFKEWNTKANGSGDSYAPGVDIIVDKESENILYAIWRCITTIEPPVVNIATDNCTASAAKTDQGGLESLGFIFHKVCGSLVISHNDVETGNCPKTVTRTYTILDDRNGNGTKDTDETEIAWVQTITVQDIEDPVISNCPANITVDTDSCEDYATVTIPKPTATDNCGTVTLAHDYADADAQGEDASGKYPIGTTTVTYTATDACNRTSTCSFTVTVNDNRLKIAKIEVDKQVSCAGGNDGKFTVTAIGGKTPYIYSLVSDFSTSQTSAVFDNKTAGTYTVYVKDADNCIVQEQVALQDGDAEPQYTLNIASPKICAGEEAVFNITNATVGAELIYTLDGEEKTVTIPASGELEINKATTASDNKVTLVLKSIRNGKCLKDINTTHEVAVFKVPTFELTANPAECNDEDSKITVEITSGVGKYLIHVSVDGVPKPAESFEITSSNPSNNKWTGVVVAGGSAGKSYDIEVKVVNADHTSCESGCL